MTWQQIALIAAFLAFWFVLNRWLLPAMGIPTCMSGQCGVPRPHGAGPTPSTPGEHDALTQHDALTPRDALRQPDALAQGEKP